MSDFERVRPNLLRDIASDLFWAIHTPMILADIEPDGSMGQWMVVYPLVKTGGAYVISPDGTGFVSGT